MRWLLLRSAEDDAETAGLAGLNPRPRAVFELLLLRANRSVKADEIIDQLWPTDSPRAARNSVQRFVADIRNALGARRDLLETTDGGYRLRVDQDDIDLNHVRRLRAEAAEQRPSDPRAAAQLAAEALDHFGDLDDQPGQTAAAATARASFRELRLELLDVRIEAQLAAGSGAEVIGELRGLTEHHPYNERFWRHLILALSNDGRRVEALREYERLRRRLADDIGIGPSDELVELQLRILGTPGPATADQAPVPGGQQGSRPPSDPDATPTDLIGRDTEIGRVTDLLSTHRVVTVTGIGGVGKTRLVMEVARRLAPSTDQRPLIVRLAEVADGRQVPDMVAVALDLQTDAIDPDGAVEEILDHLHRHPRPIVLDNAEHVIDAVRHLVDGLRTHTGCPVLVSSRQRLDTSDEWVVPLDPLPGPGPDGEPDGTSPAERLLELRAAAVGADLHGQADTVAAICRALDGLPLAIELAAAQLAHSGARDLLDRLDARRLDLASADGRPDRHSTLAAMMEWSWTQLAADQVELLQLLAVFNAPVSMTTAEDLVGDQAFPVLGGLVSRSLITSTVVDGRARFSLLETVRLYALARVEDDGRLADCRHAHANYLLGFLRRWAVPDLNAWLDTIDDIEHHHLEYGPALEWLDQQGRVDDVIEMVTRVTGLWARRGPGSQLSHWAARLLELADEVDLDHEATVAVAVTAAEDRFRYSDHLGVATHGDRLVALDEIAPTDLGTPFVAFWGTALHTFDLTPASRAIVEAANGRAAKTPSRDLNEAQTEMWLGSCQLMDREFEAALASFSSVLRRTSRPSGALLWSELGRVAALHLLDRPVEARAALDGARSTSEDSIWNYAVDIVRAVLSAAAGEAERARADLVAAAHRRIRERRAASRDDFQIGFGLVAAADGDHDLAAELLASPMPQSPVLATLLFNHLHPDPATGERWQAIWAEAMLTRILALTERLGQDLPAVEAELARWAPAPNSN